jgi:biopolymer transport protein ExbD
MIGRRRLRRRREPEDLELTAFINPMVVLVTFLLVNVVFSHSSVLNLNLPAPSTVATATPAEKLLLEITVRKNSLEVGDRNRGRLADLPDTANGLDLAQLGAQLQQLKTRYPEQKDATVLVEADIPYDRLVQVMDAVRTVEQQVDGRRSQAELFPEIAIGDAPLADAKPKAK